MGLKLKFDAKLNQVTLDLNKLGRTARQRWNLAQMVKENDFNKIVSYAKTFEGYKNSCLGIEKLQVLGQTDMLANRKKGHYTSLLEKWCDPTQNHKPVSKNSDWIGVEIECMIPTSAFNDIEAGEVECEECNGRGDFEDDDGDTMECDSCSGSGHVHIDEDDSFDNLKRQLANVFKRKSIKHVSIHYDGSIESESGYQGVEVTVLTRLGHLLNLKRTCDVLNELGAKVNKSCGMHVHLDARHLDVEGVVKVGKKFKNAMPVLLAMVPKSRRDNRYCKPVVSPMTDDSDKRYCAVNLIAYSKHKTIEVRLHSSTTDFVKISNWAHLIHAIAVAKKVRPCETICKLSEDINISEDVMEYVAQRMALFDSKMTCTNARALDGDNLDADNITSLVNQIEMNLNNQTEAA